MLEKTFDAVIAYCFGVAELFCTFFERTHAVIGLAVPLLIMILVHVYLPAWAAVAVATFVVAPAAAAMTTVIVHGLLLTRRR